MRRWIAHTRTLAFRLATGYALAGLAFISLATVLLYFVLVRQLDRSTNLFIEDKLNVVRTLLRERPDDWDALREEIELETSAREYQRFYIRLRDQRGTVLLSTPGMDAQLGRKAGGGYRIETARAAVGEPARSYDRIEVAVDVSQEMQLLSEYRHWFLAILGAACVFLPFVGYRIARQGIRPVEEIAATARQISSSNLRERMEPEGYPSELASLATTFNKMLDGLEESFERISRFSADIAHDLRTPVNNIRGEAEVALVRARTVEEYRESLGSCLEEAVRLSNLIGDLLFLARAESPLPLLRRKNIDVPELLARVREYYDAAAVDSEVSLEVSANERVSAALDEALVQRALSNLVSNAIAHTPAGGSVRMKASREGPDLRVEVADTGCGIPSDAVPKVFDRFFRVDTSRSRALGGTGLGLAIVQSIAVLHGGSAQISSKVGEGTRVILDFPGALADMTES